MEDTKDGWYKVEVDDQKGYISGDYVEVTEKLPTASTVKRLNTERDTRIPAFLSTVCITVCFRKPLCVGGTKPDKLELIVPDLRCRYIYSQVLFRLLILR